MINYISARYERLRGVEGRREKREGVGRAESFIIIRKGNVAIPVGRYGASDKEYVWEMSLPSTPQPTDLFQGQWSAEVGGFIFGFQGLEARVLLIFLHRQCQLKIYWLKQHQVIAMKTHTQKKRNIS